MNRKMPTTAWISGLSKSRFRPLTMNGMPRRRSSSTSGPESFATDRNSTAQSDHDRPRGSASGPSGNGDAAHALDAVDDPRRLRLRVVELEGEQVAALPRLVTGRDHRLRQPLTGRDALGDRAAELDDALCSTESCRRA